MAAKDLGDKPLYIMPTSRLPTNMGRNADCNGYTDVFLEGDARVIYRGDLWEEAWLP